MLQLTPHHTILLAVHPIDFRRGIDGLAGVCKEVLKHDPFSGIIFVFTNKSRRSVKILVYDGLGFWLISRRFSSGKLKWWPTEKTTSFECASTELHILLQQGLPEGAHLQKEWRRLKPPLTKEVPLRET